MEEVRGSSPLSSTVKSLVRAYFCPPTDMSELWDRGAATADGFQLRARLDFLIRRAKSIGGLTAKASTVLRA